jgi:hypothetical protein
MVQVYIIKQWPKKRIFGNITREGEREGGLGLGPCPIYISVFSETKSRGGVINYRALSVDLVKPV